ncbi:winged helix-turn-helix domain-containing protein [Shewanella olleyana]|uniref:winged helix-turn-helix domain-containing protein n=1 Tax=Shewanella olleyana TaxID=135626 RepID=UPI00200C0A2D|nr:winged helix-turn-helix domain-containing protein [Shewanella olleyana]MCL1067214.1 winged helix-turn-helix domain-containing protein [Shewanella olleyana]
MKYKINGFILSTDIHFATRGEEKINFTYQETAALKLFLASENGFVDAQTLEKTVWGERVVTQNSLRKLISAIRLKFGDKESIKNIRNKGYQLTFEVFQENVNKAPIKLSSTILVIPFMVLILSMVSIHYAVSNNSSTPLLPKVSQQTVFESHDYIVDYAKFNDALYVTTRDSKTSKLYKTVNRQNTTLLSANYPGAYRGIEIHSSGRTVMHVVEDSKCKIKIFAKPFEYQIDEIPCNRQNAYPSFDWINKNKFYITFNVNPSDSIKPYTYDIEEKLLQKVTTTNFDSGNGKRFIDAFIKGYGDGMFSMRENNLDEVSLIYFEGDNRKTLLKFRNKPYSIAVSENDLFYVGNNNELLRTTLTDDIHSQELNTSYVLAPQTVKISDPLMLENELYFALGNAAQESILSHSGNFNYSLANTIIDFTYTTKVLSILAITNSGYVVEQLKDGTVFNSTYFDTTLNLRQIAFHKGEVYLAGSSGVYKLVNGKLISISDIKTIKIVSNGQCFIAEAEKGIYQFEAESNSFKLFTEQGVRAFSSEQGCLFVDNLSGYIINEKREKIAKPILVKYLFEHKGKLAHWHYVGEHTHIVDVESGEIIAKLPNRALYKRVISYEDDILYLGQKDVRTSIVKIKLDE